MKPVRRLQLRALAQRDVWRVALVIGVAACAAESGVPTTWSQLNVGTLQLELEDKEKYELLSFHPEGAVSATIGLKKGPITAPLLYWHIDSNRLVITESPGGGGTVQSVMKNPRLDGHRLFVSVSGAGKRTYVIRRSDA